MTVLTSCVCRAGLWRMRKQRTCYKQRKYLNLTQWSGAHTSPRKSTAPNMTSPSQRAAPTPTLLTQAVTSVSWGSRMPWAPWFLHLTAPLGHWTLALKWRGLTKRNLGTIAWWVTPPCTAMSTAPWVHSIRVMETKQRHLEEPSRIRPKTTLLYLVNDYHTSLMTWPGSRTLRWSTYCRNKKVL